MRRIYDSDALARDDDDPFTPSERDDRSRSAIDWGNASHAFLPVRLRSLAVSVSLELAAAGQRDGEGDAGAVYDPGEPIRWRVTAVNRLPFPVRLVTETAEPWRWAVDGIPRASRVSEPVPERSTVIDFARRERKVIERRLEPRIRVSRREWEPLEPGDHTLSVALNVANAAERGLRDEATIRIRDGDREGEHGRSDPSLEG